MRRSLSRTTLLQIAMGPDYQLPAIARDHGWNLSRVQWYAGTPRPVALSRRPSRAGACSHRSTDGSVPCRDCRVTASDFINAARGYLDTLV